MIAEHLTVEEAAGLKEGFKVMDINNRGKINIDELRVGLHKLGHQVPESDVQILMEAVSTNNYIILYMEPFSPELIFKKVPTFS